MSSTSVRLRPHSSQACFSARSVSNPISAGATMSSFASAGKQRFGSEEQPASQPARGCPPPVSAFSLNVAKFPSTSGRLGIFGCAQRAKRSMLSGVSQMKESPRLMHFPRPSATGQSLPYITFCAPKVRMRAFVAPASVTAPCRRAVQPA